MRLEQDDKLEVIEILKRKLTLKEKDKNVRTKGIVENFDEVIKIKPPS